MSDWNGPARRGHGWGQGSSLCSPPDGTTLGAQLRHLLNEHVASEDDRLKILALVDAIVRGALQMVLTPPPGGEPHG